MDKPRVMGFDIAKAIGILLVVAGHVLPENNCLRIFIYTFHMPLFFFLSGVFINVDYKRTRDAIYYGVRNLVCSYIFWSAMYLIFDFVVDFLILRRIPFDTIVTNAYATLIFRGILVLWFIPALVFAKILTILLAKATRSRVILTAAALVLIVTPDVINKVIVEPNPLVFSFFVYHPVIGALRAMNVSAFVLLGFVYKDWLYKIVAQTNVVTQLACVLCLALNILVFDRFGQVDYYEIDPGLPLISLAMGISGTVAVLGIASLIARKPLNTIAFWTFISANSTFIFATHMYFSLTEIIRTIVVSFVKYDNYYIKIVLLLLLEIVLCLTVAPMVNRILKRMSNRSDRIFGKKKISNNRYEA